MKQEDLVRRTLQTARVVATIGAKNDGIAPASTVPARMAQLGIRIIPVNPTIAEAFGEPSRKSIADVNEPIDVIQIFRRSEALSGIADEIIALPARLRPHVVWLQLGIHDPVAIARLRASGIEVVEDRCYAVELAKHGGPPPA